jgi:hypothetical protein
VNAPPLCGCAPLPTWRGAYLATLLVVGVGSLSPRARAEAATAALVVTRDPGAAACPDTDQLVTAVNAVAERAAAVRFDGHALPVQATVQIGSVEGGLRATVEVRGERQGRRELIDDDLSCRTLADGLALTLAILLDDTPGLAPPVVEATAAPAAAAPAREPPAASPVAPAQPAGTRWSLGGELGTGIGVALVGAATPVVSVGIVWRPSARSSLGLVALHAFEQQAALAPGSVDVALDLIGLRACRAVVGNPRQTALLLCVEPLVGALQGSGRDFDEARVERLRWSGVAGGLRAEGAIGDGLVWTVHALGVAPFVRQAFVATVDSEPAAEFVIPAAGALFGFGIRGEFGGS